MGVPRNMTQFHKCCKSLSRKDKDDYYRYIYKIFGSIKRYLAIGPLFTLTSGEYRDKMKMALMHSRNPLVIYRYYIMGE